MPRVQFKPIPENAYAFRDHFWSKVQILEPHQCWPWLAGCNADGYGVFHINYIQFICSRVAFFFEYGVDLETLRACHSCDNPPCCNPEHIFSGTTADNQTDMVRKGRAKSGDEHWSKLYPERIARGERSGMRLHPESVRRGDNNGNSVLVASQVLAIRSNTALTQVKLAEKFGVSRSTIQSIIYRKLWKHI